jgi:SAM-dependent methyltransferase
VADYAYQEEVNLPVLAALRGIPAGASVLDVGCGRGQLGEAARALGLRVTGLELHPDACAVARDRLDRLVEADLTDHAQVDAALGDERFDAVVFSDVLEHVPWPAAVLGAYRPRVAPGGVVIVSVPNVASWDSRLRLLAGRFRYEDTGLMDRTHLRFFTVDTARELVEQAGFRVVGQRGDPMIARAALPWLKRRFARADADGSPRAMLESPAYRRYTRFVLPVESAAAALWPRGLWFRIVVTGAPEGPA